MHLHDQPDGAPAPGQVSEGTLIPAVDAGRKMGTLRTLSPGRISAGQHGNHPMSYAYLFNGKAWQIRQKVLRHILVSDVGKEKVPVNVFLLSFYHILDHDKCGRATESWDLQIMPEKLCE